MGFLAKQGLRTEFQIRIGQLLNEVHSSPQIEQAAFYEINDLARAVPFDTLRSRINGVGRLKKYNRTGLGVAQTFQTVLSQPNADKVVSVLVTDLTDHSASKLNLAALEDDVTSAMAGLRKQRLSASVYTDSSRFYGDFTPAYHKSGRRQQLSGTVLPYYIWVIGPPALVARFNREIFRDRPARQAHVGLSFPNLAYAVRLQSVMKPEGQMSYAGAPTQPAVKADFGQGKREFAVALDLSGLPPELQEPAVLNAQLILDKPGTTAELVAGSARRLTEAEHGNSALEAYSHVVRVRVTGVSAAQTTLTLRLPAPPLPAWVAAQSTLDDAIPTRHPARTYHLDWILSGARKAYGATPPPVFSLPIHLVKKTD